MICVRVFTTLSCLGRTQQPADPGHFERPWGSIKMPIDLIIQLVSGALGGNLASFAGKNVNLGWIWNTVLGLAGGAAGGQLLGPIVGPLIGVAANASAANLDPMTILSSVLTGGGSGLILTTLAGLVKSMVFKPAA